MKDKNPKKKRAQKGRKKRVPAKKKAMSLRTAKKIWFAPRRKGRPSAALKAKLSEAKKVLLAAKEPLKRAPLRKRGRPRTKPRVEKPKRPRGRPRKHPKSDKPKRPRGRPRKHPKTNKPKRPRGRPRKHPKTEKPKRPRGRPRKAEEELKGKRRKKKKPKED